MPLPCARAAYDGVRTATINVRRSECKQTAMSHTTPPPTTSGELAIEVLRRNAAAFAEHAPEAHAGSDAEHVHQTRVATRRMRAAIRVFADVLPGELDGLDAELKWIAGQLGPVRDLDVQIMRLNGIAADLEV